MAIFAEDDSAVVPPPPREYAGRITWTVVFAIISGSMGGAIYGYDVGVTGGVTSMEDWQAKFFPDVLAEAATVSPYCKLNNQLLQLFTSSSYLAGMFSCLAAAYLTKRYGRRVVMVLSGIFFIAGVILQAASQEIGMLIVGRVVLGLGTGLSSMVVPLYLSEISPKHLRGVAVVIFQLTFNIAVLAAGLINLRTNTFHDGWRYSLGFAGVPGAIFLFGSMLLPDTPSSLIERGRVNEARTVLQRIRAVEDVSAEFDDLIEASRAAAMHTHQWRSLFSKRYRPHLIICVLTALFQQLTGISIIEFYAPQVFGSLGNSIEDALINNVIVNIIPIIATIIAIFLLDTVGRRVLFLEGGFQMGATLIICGTMLGVEFKRNGGVLTPSVNHGILAMVCIYNAGFSWSWAPLGWLIPTEISPIEIRSAAVSAAVFTNLLLTFLVGQAFLSMLCSMQYGVYLFFAGFVILMTAFAWWFIPETKDVPMEGMQDLLRAHWFWGSRMYPADAVEPSAELAIKMGTDAAGLKELQLPQPSSQPPSPATGVPVTGSP